MTTNLKKRAIALLARVGLRGWVSLPGGNPSELDAFWDHADNTSEKRVDHTLWQNLLDRYLKTQTADGIHLFDYAGLQAESSEQLKQYVDTLLDIEPRALNKQEQMCFWINLYNAVTVQLILAHHPIKSITEIGQQKNRFGPWDDVLIRLSGQALTLNHIEHRILRPLYGDYRVHFAVNCASLGCPNLSAQVFTVDHLEAMLDDAARQFIAHPRGVRFESNKLVLSSIFEWYESDFGACYADLLTTLAQHADASLAEKLNLHRKPAVYEYDWRLNSIS